MLSLPEVWVPSSLRELGSHKPRGMAPKKEYTSVIDQVLLAPPFVLRSSKWGSCPLCLYRGWCNLGFRVVSVLLMAVDR